MGMKWPPRAGTSGAGDSIDCEDRLLLLSLRRALASGDRGEVDRAFEAIYRAYARVVAFVVARFLRDDADVVSVTDDVFIAFFRRCAEGGEVENLRAYLTAAARHRAMDVLRAAGRRTAGVVSPPTDDNGEDLSFLDRIPDPDSDVGASIRYRELVADLTSVLEVRTVTIILRHAVYGETFGAIGERLGIKESTAKTLYHRGLATFRKKKGESWL